MNQSLAHTALVVRDYDEAIAFYVDVLGFDLVADEYQAEQDKRWVVVRPKGDGQAGFRFGQNLVGRRGRHYFVHRRCLVPGVARLLFQVLLP